MRVLKPGIVICSRLSSSRIPRKALLDINGRSILEHLIFRLLGAEVPIYVAVPGNELGEYSRALGPYLDKVMLLVGPEEDPLARTDIVARMVGLDTVIRITHDKIFVDPEDIKKALGIFESSNLDYLYSSSFVPGTGFEVIDARVLHTAAERFKNVEHISYAIRAVTERKSDIPMGHATSPHRLLIDYPEDVHLMTEIFYRLGNGCNNRQVLALLDLAPALSAINRLPLLTVYTCAYNAEKWLSEAVKSVMLQERGFPIEYLMIDDGSTDSTSSIMQDVHDRWDKARWILNHENRGLASSCNRALAEARGKYILRLDADDFFTSTDALQRMVSSMESHDFDVMYPDHFFGGMLHVEKGNVHHHAGGAIFRTQALNHMKFTDGLRGFEGYDLFERAKAQLKIGYFDSPTFFYRQHEASLTKGCPDKRAEIKKEIDDRVTPRD